LEIILEETTQNKFLIYFSWW